MDASHDIAQESYLAAWTGLRNLRNPQSFFPWLRQLTRNQAHQWRRKNTREIADEPSLSVAADPRPAPDQKLLDSEEQRLLDEVLDQLPDEAREVLVLYYREEKSTAQVALLLGISEEAVRQRVSRSRAMIRTEMLQRFERHVAGTTPGAAFFAALAGALTFAAPAASAAVAAGAGATSSLGAATTASIVKASLIGGVFGWFGVLMGMRYLEPPFDEKEARELRSFRNYVLAVVTIGCPVVAISTSSVLAMLVVLQSLYLILAVLYGIKLPRILARRTEFERSMDPELAKRNGRRRLWATAGRAAGAAIGGTMLMDAPIPDRQDPRYRCGDRGVASLDGNHSIRR